MKENLIDTLGELQYELVPGSQLYVLKDFDNVKEAFNKAIENLHVNEVLEEETQAKAYKKRRTTINNAKKKITRVRLDLTECVMGKFQNQCKELEAILDQASREMGANLKAFEDKHKEPTPPTYTITISSGSKKVIEKIRKYVEKEGDAAYLIDYEVEN